MILEILFGLSSVQCPLPKSVSHELAPIAHLESSCSKDLGHKQHKDGEYYTAFGPLGLKPATAHEEYSKAYPKLDQERFLVRFKSDQNLYFKLANLHWARLKRVFGTKHAAVYAWRRGISAARKTSDHQIKLDPYVAKYMELNKS